MDPTRGDSRYNLNYSMSSIGLSLADQADMYGNPAAVAALGGRPPSGGIIQNMGGTSSGLGIPSRGVGLMTTSPQCQTLTNTNSTGSPQQHQQRGIKRTGSDCYEDHHRVSGNSSLSQSLQGLESCAGPSGGSGPPPQTSSVPDVDDNYTSLQNKKSPPANGKKTKGRVKIKMEYIDNKLRRYTTFSKRKTGIMKKAYELSTLTGTQVMLLVASETGHVYTFATRKLQPMITSEAGKQLIQTCLNSPDPPSVGGGDQRMSATGFEETELSYNIADEDSKDDRSPTTSGNESEDSSDVEMPSLQVTDLAVHEKLDIGNDTTLSAVNQMETTRLYHSTVPMTTTTTAKTKTAETRVGSLKKESHAFPSPESSNSNVNVNSQFTCENGKKSFSENSAMSQSDNYVFHPSAALANIPQDVLLKLIQSGHLQLHTEEDGHQFVAIPLSSADLARIKCNKPINGSSDASEKPLPSGQLTTTQSKSVLESFDIKQELD